MGGDHAPEQIVLGCLEAAKTMPEVDWILAGDQSRIQPLLSGASALRNLSVRHCTQVIEMDESPVNAVRRKRDASLVVCGNLVREGQADGFFSAGHSGAAMAVAALQIGRIPGIDRPAITLPLPSSAGKFVLIDAGANVDCDHTHLLEFAVMGMVYAEVIMGIRQPRVGLLSNGEEDSKGNQAVKAAHKLLRGSGLPFIGNVEARDVFAGKADVVVCDGFVGNVLLKTAEGVASMVTHFISDEVKAHPLLKVPIAMLMGALRRMKRRIDPDEYGGALLMGVQKVCIIGHGSSKAKSVTNGLRLTVRSVSENVVQKVEARMTELSDLFNTAAWLLDENGSR